MNGNGTWHAIDTLGAGTIIATVLGYLPAVAAGVALLWYMIQIWESKTIQHWLENRRMVRKAKKIARLKAKEKIISAELEALETVRQAKAEARDKVAIATVEAAKIQIKEETEAEKGEDHG